MKRVTTPHTVFTVFVLFLSLGISAQDAHYSQTGNSPLNLNPGLTGVFDGNHRFIANMRRQWGSVPVPYFQLATSWDTRFLREEKPGHWGAGLQFNYDRAGDAGLSLAHIGLNGSYTLRVYPEKKQFFTMGFAMGVMQRAISPGKLTFDDQYLLSEGFSSINPTGEVIDKTAKIMGSLSAGVNYRFQKDSSRMRLDLGAASFHFNEPKKNLKDQDVATLQQRVSLYALGAFPAGVKFDLLVSLSAQLQHSNRETILGFGGLYYVSTKRTQELGLQANLYYRAGDAIIPSVAIHYQAWQVHLSYDINTSPLKEATMRRGGPEFSIIYLLRNVPDLTICKNCPTYM